MKTKTTQGKATRAYLTLDRMGNRTLPANAAFRLFKVKKALQSAFEFETEEEKKYLAEFGGELKDGFVNFETPEKAKGFETKKKELDSMEIEVEVEVPTIRLEEMKEVTISELEALEGFVNFK